MLLWPLPQQQCGITACRSSVSSQRTNRTQQSRPIRPVDAAAAGICCAIVAAGTHADLVKNDPLYARLAALQFGQPGEAAA